MAKKVLRLPAVKDRTGLSRSTIYAQIKEGKFPKPIRLGKRAVGWTDEDIDAHIASLITEQEGEAA